MPITGNWLGSGHPSPTQYASAVLKGAASYDEVPGAIQSLLRKPIYDEAVKIICEADKENRRKMLTALPNSIRDEVAKEVTALWPRRQQLLR